MISLDCGECQGYFKDVQNVKGVFVQLGPASVFSPNLGPKVNTKIGLHTNPNHPTPTHSTPPQVLGIVGTQDLACRLLHG